MPATGHEHDRPPGGSPVPPAANEDEQAVPVGHPITIGRGRAPQHRARIDYVTTAAGRAIRLGIGERPALLLDTYASASQMLGLLEALNRDHRVPQRLRHAIREIGWGDLLDAEDELLALEARARAARAGDLPATTAPDEPAPAAVFRAPRVSDHRSDP